MTHEITAAYGLGREGGERNFLAATLTRFVMISRLALRALPPAGSVVVDGRGRGHDAPVSTRRLDRAGFDAPSSTYRDGSPGVLRGHRSALPYRIQPQRRLRHERKPLTRQKWRFNADGTITAVGANKCLDVAEYGTANGSKIHIWTCH
ncbi:ricin-type beta-trefoil lectin domain protein [Sphaerimonospora mesophila]|uniref:ricin-type beta-trefoil lectin domain protein n=1 Tax=Sphaerimonospora mesophila TaxID=37483 RepID=UPI001F478FB0